MLESQRNQEAYMMPGGRKGQWGMFRIYQNHLCRFPFLLEWHLFIGAKFILDTFQRDNQITHIPLIYRMGTDLIMLPSI